MLQGEVIRHINLSKCLSIQILIADQTMQQEAPHLKMNMIRNGWNYSYKLLSASLQLNDDEVPVDGIKEKESIGPEGLHNKCYS